MISTVHGNKAPADAIVLRHGLRDIVVCDGSDIIFAFQTARSAHHSAQPNIPAQQSHSPKANITEEAAFRLLLLASGYEIDGFAFLTDGFEPSKMMPPHSAANDVSPFTLRNDVAPIGRNDAMFAHHVPQHTSLPQAASLAKPTSFARKGKHH